MNELNITKRTKDDFTYKILSLFFGITFALVGIINFDILKILVGILLIFYFTYKRSIYLTELGLIYKYKALLFNKEECLHFIDIDEITVVKQRNNCNIFFISNDIAKKVDINIELVDDIVKFIKSNTKILINLETK